MTPIKARRYKIGFTAGLYLGLAACVMLTLYAMFGDSIKWRLFACYGASISGLIAYESHRLTNTLAKRLKKDAWKARRNARLGIA